jgi:hypothetical protein
MMRCSWALTVFGARQALGLAGGSAGGGDDASPGRSLDAVTFAAEEQLDPMSRGIYRTGERLQGGFFDLVCDLAAAGAAWSPRRLMDRASGRATRPEEAPLASPPPVWEE